MFTRVTRKTWGWALAALALLMVLATALAAGVWLWRSAEPAPQVNFTTLQGEQFSTAQLRGKVVLVNFWATSCTTCIKEMPLLIQTHQKFAPRGYETVAVAMAYDRPDFVLNFSQTRQLPFKVVYDQNNRIASAFHDTQVTPTTFLLNKRGDIVKRYVGAPNEKELHALIEKELAV